MGLLELQQLKNKPKGLPEKKVYYLPKISKKRAALMAAEKDGKGDSGMDKWFEERRKEMKGVCVFCGGKTEKPNDETYRRSIAHLLAKRSKMFPSVAKHSDNWLELCFYGNSCHTNFDNGMITWDFLHDSKEWEIIVAKFKKIFPFIALTEHKNIPYLLLKEIINPDKI